MSKSSKYDNRLRGTIIQIDDGKGRLQCDDKDIGEVFIPSRADYRQRILKNVYQVGDNVTFCAIPANSPKKGCKFVALLMNKEDDSSEVLMENVNACVSFVVPTHGFLLLPHNHGRVFFHIDDVDDDDVKDLTVSFPIKSQVVCNLEMQTPHNGCIYRARNVRRVFQQNVTKPFFSDKNLSSAFSQDFESSSSFRSSLKNDVDEGQSSKTKSNNDNIYRFNEDTKSTNDDVHSFGQSSGSGPIAPKTSATCDAECQTEKMFELQAVHKILASEKIFQIVCAECPEALKALMQSNLKL